MLLASLRAELSQSFAMSLRFGKYSSIEMFPKVEELGGLTLGSDWAFAPRLDLLRAETKSAPEVYWLGRERTAEPR